MNPLFFSYSPKIQLWLMALLFLFLTACESMPAHQVYEGQPKTDNEVATFIVPEKFNLLAIDGTEYSRMSIRDGATLKVLPGLHEILIEYRDVWDLGGTEFEKVASKPIAIKVTLQAGKQYTIDSTILEDLDQAWAFAKKPKVTIIDTASKQSVSAEIKYNRYVGNLINSLFASSETEPTQPSETSGKPETANEGKALEMLKYWWETADKEQQAHFQQWLKK